MATLINGDGNPAVYAIQDADFYTALLGGQTRILNRGLKFAYHIENINTFLIDDGLILTKEGRRIQLDSPAQDEITIPNGVQGSTQYYIVGYHLYTDADANQVCETFIRQMESATATIEEKTFYEGETEVYISLYRLTQAELVVSTVQLLLPYDTTQAQDRASLAADLAEVNETLGDIETMFSGTESSSTASQAYGVGDVFQMIVSGHRYLVQATSEIAQGDTIEIGTNVRVTDLSGVVSDVSEFGTRIDNLETYTGQIDSGKQNNVTWYSKTLAAASWTANNGTYIYSLESDYPSATYDIEDVIPNSSTTSAMRNAWAAADCGGYEATNIIRCHGAKPTIDITLGVCVKKKGGM